ncbi:MAG: hypothetical protein FWB96_13545 [Defluviitaleaceae bacterium]|nr:hypothetical protein [Defluviitaleaceae bacterium]
MMILLLPLLVACGTIQQSEESLLDIDSWDYIVDDHLQNEAPLFSPENAPANLYRVHFHIRDGSNRWIISRVMNEDEYLTVHDIIGVYKDGVITYDTALLNLENFELRAWVENSERSGIYTTDVYISDHIDILAFPMSELATKFDTTVYEDLIILHAHAVWVPRQFHDAEILKSDLPTHPGLPPTPPVLPEIPELPVWQPSDPPPPREVPSTLYMIYRVHFHLHDGSGYWIIGRTLRHDEYLTPHDIITIYEDGVYIHDTSRLNLQNFTLRGWTHNEDWGGMYTTDVYIPDHIDMLAFPMSELATKFRVTRSGNIFILHAHAIWVPMQESY